MNNTYYLMRHGRSESNDLKVIACSPEKSVTGFGLTEQGSQQARQAAAQFAQKVGVTPVIFASDFLRAQQTAEAVASACKTTVTCDVRLRERDFGELDRTPSDNYHKGWDA